jgi:ketosteroid isomerase-like protein
VPKGGGALELEIQTYQRIFSDLHFTIEDILAQGDTVVIMGSATDTFRYRTITTCGGSEIPASLGTKWVHVVRIEEGKVKSDEHYVPGDITGQ